MPPTTLDDLRDAISQHTALRVRAGGTKSPTEPRAVVDLAGLNGILDYSPDECVFTARAATPLAAISDTLAAHGQYLPFDPPFAEEGATIGGTVASGMSGPRRYRYGGVRDFLIGVELVDGASRVIRSGGKVVKNAAGFLLHHALVGSWGRFGVLTEVTFKVFPAPEARRLIDVPCASVEQAWALARGLETRRADCEAIDFTDEGALTITVAGRESAIAARAERLLATLPPHAHLATRRPPPISVTLHDLVKVPGAAGHWSRLREYVSAASFTCAGAVAFLTTPDIQPLAAALRAAGLAGQVVRGPHAGARVGGHPHNEFEERVARVLDPGGRFHAAPHLD
jgi:glycolate oxidase FAD binding subunit